MEGLTPDALQQMMLYEWPGNVRELANVIERAVVLATNYHISPDLLHLRKRELESAKKGLLTLKEARERSEKTYLVQVLTSVKVNVLRAAIMAGKDRSEFCKLLRKHTLNPWTFKEKPAHA